MTDREVLLSMPIVLDQGLLPVGAPSHMDIARVHNKGWIIVLEDDRWAITTQGRKALDRGPLGRRRRRRT